MTGSRGSMVSMLWGRSATWEQLGLFFTSEWERRWRGAGENRSLMLQWGDKADH